MKSWLLILSLSVVAIAGVQVSLADPQQVQGVRSPTLSFCQARFYEEEDGRLYCNWAVNFRYACFVWWPTNKIIPAGAKLSEPEVVGKCGNGEPVVKLHHY
ncbi:hypothetical protein ACJJI5_09315 [Microbulbifer sp. EKSA008]|uniref:hypothetical protein n=1 Tax=unclassified Microbulbifer TaxID=2619833 RepID=UPI0024AD5C10|nr:hypothetical protein [Microbulbifer sp. VAAF005]WHI47782.1 hypothetical protein P0078_05135 [Microbulbifer sp. VAAF005]WNZ57986.1 hypothetical protein QT397_11850 [Microbulbifer sp. MKSA007]